eukprot:scaffold14129_cov133-Isochrysis_galbana.AAC.3
MSFPPTLHDAMHTRDEARHVMLISAVGVRQWLWEESATMRNTAIHAALLLRMRGSASGRMRRDTLLSPGRLAKKKLVRLKKPRLPSALGLSGACGEEAY